ncbi:DNA (cytosine-5-)-methyltransferase [Lachnoanaerobaculum gingivalis]|uniref:Cytosine-specific methyltransferase n=1 Tax=Lachnoanaerobaculum gingivalis TaxID=2490855 RepID=A0A3P3QXH6_9FIRM|nr:DNA cytosine methyltransferase [Lachnoanaerobaculum gingivalis]RRJ25269.1 DNA (cytosine-5-)-methyltransferase [Lachnoanaerobaculum gingivalis]
MGKPTSTNKNPNYHKLLPYLSNKEFDEAYALVSHYIQSNGSVEANEYRKLLLEHGVNVDNLPSADKFNKAFDVPFPASKSEFTFIDLFAGIGGFRLAMQNNGGRCVFSSEWDDAAKQTYFENYGEVPFGDITKPETKALIPEKFDVLCAGFPCQPFSYSGQKLGFKDKTKGTLFFDVCEILKAREPQAFFLENVKGIVSHDKGKTIETIRSILKDELGYDIHECILSSLDFGLPQKRERWYCVGFKKNTDFVFPEGTNSGATLRDIIDLANNNSSLKLPKFELDRIKYHFAHADEIRVKHDNSKYAPKTKKGKYGVYSFQKPDGSLRFHVGDPAKTQIQEAFYSCLESYASTIIANRTPKLWDIERKLSVRESARLQGFPDEFMIPVSDAQGYKQFGNSVSVPVLTEIVKNLIEHLVVEGK